MSLPTEPIGSIPRPAYLIDCWKEFAEGRVSTDKLEAAIHDALQDTIRQFESTGSPVITDGEQGKSSFATYPLQGAANLASDGISIPFADGHARQLPRLTAGPFRYAVRASSFLRAAKRITLKPVKQAVISSSALSLLYPRDGISDYPREQFLDDLTDGAEADIRECLEAGAANVQIDFTEGRLAAKLDPSLTLLGQFIGLNNRVLDRFSAVERQRLGVHSCLEATAIPRTVRT